MTGPASLHAPSAAAFQASLGWRTELAFARFDGRVVDAGDHLVVRTPTNPTYWWGNYLLFPRPPREGEAADWIARFEDEIRRGQPASRHLAFGVDASGDFSLPADFVAQGLTMQGNVVLTRGLEDGGPRVEPPPAGVFAPLDLARDAGAVVDKHVIVDAGRFETCGYRVYAAKQMARYAAMDAAGLGHWFGWWVDAPAANDGSPSAGRVLAASCGLFRCDVGLDRPVGRFQYVSTHPDWRRRGLCRALVAAACRHAHARMGLEDLVMMADPDDVAIGIYESLGFARGVRMWHIEKGSVDAR